MLLHALLWQHRSLGLWRYLDMGCDDCRHEIRALVHARKPRCRYGPAQLIGFDTAVVVLGLKQEHISTGYIERQKLAMRICMRRFAGLTVTPATEPGIAGHAWTIEEMLDRVGAK